MRIHTKLINCEFIENKHFDGNIILIHKDKTKWYIGKINQNSSFIYTILYYRDDIFSYCVKNPTCFTLMELNNFYCYKILSIKDYDKFAKCKTKEECEKLLDNIETK